MEEAVDGMPAGYSWLLQAGSANGKSTIEGKLAGFGTKEGQEKLKALKTLCLEVLRRVASGLLYRKETTSA